MFNIYIYDDDDEPESPNEAACLRIEDELESPKEGARTRYMNPNRKRAGCV